MIKSFDDIVKMISPYALAGEAGMTYYMFRKKAADPSLFTEQEVERMARHFWMTTDELKTLISAGKSK